MEKKRQLCSLLLMEYCVEVCHKGCQWNEMNSLLESDLHTRIINQNAGCRISPFH